MHICFFTHYTTLMGANRSMLELLDNLLLLGCEVSVISNGYGEINSELDKRGITNRSFTFKWWMKSPNGIINHIMWPIWRWYYSKYNEKASKEIAVCLREFDVDIIHTNSSVINVGAKVASMLHVPHVWHIREYGFFDYDLKFLAGDMKSISYMQQNSAQIIFISQDLAKSYIGRLPNMTDFSVIFNGVALKSYSVKKNPSFYTEDVLNLVVCGLVSPKKNQIEVLRAISSLPDDIKKQLCCKIVGNGEANYIAKLKKFCHDEGIDNIVEFLGYRDDVPKILKAAHIAVMPSHREAFGRVTVEYMMAGLGVIASDTGANPEIIQNGVTGQTYHLGDTHALAACIADFVNNREKLARIAIAGHDNALVEFDSMNCAKKILSVYRSIKSNRNMLRFENSKDICPPL